MRCNEINLSKTYISAELIGGLKSLELLDLRFNNLTRIDFSLVPENITKIWIAGNHELGCEQVTVSYNNTYTLYI